MPCPPSEIPWRITMGRSSVPGELKLRLESQASDVSSPFPRDRDQDSSSGNHCAQLYTGGWWYNQCYQMHPTGQHTATKTTLGSKQIVYYHGKARGNTETSWAEAEFLLLPN